MINWKPKLNAGGKEVGIIEGFVGELLVATIKETGPAHRPPERFYQGEFFSLRAHYFRDTIEEAQRTAEDYWQEVLNKTGLEAAEERRWH